MMALPAYDALLEEIDRIVNSPYPTQMKHLRDLLCTTCTQADISRWLVSKPCQLDKLVGCVLDGLRHWPYVLDIITRLSHHSDIRDALLSQEPTLLREIIVQAINSHNATSKYSNAAVTVLSHPLPKHIALPSEIQSLFVHLFDRAAQQPSVDTIRPIYKVLSGTSTLLIGLLSDAVLVKLESHLFEILRNLKGDDQSLSLFCLAIMRVLGQSTHELFTDFPVSSYDTQELLASTQLTASSKWKPDTVQQFFTASKAQRTMQLIALRVMWACNASTGDSIDEKAESLALANKIVTAVPVLEREAWRKANALLLKKFEEKVFAPSLDTSIRFQALCFLFRLTEGCRIPTAVLDSLRQVILNTDKIIEVLNGCDLESIEYLVNSDVFDENTTTAFIQKVVDLTAAAAPEKLLRTSSMLVSLLQQLHKAMACHDPIIDGTMLAFDVISCGTKLSCLARLAKSSTTELGLEEHAGLCARAVRDSRRSLIHELCNVLLRAALSSHQRYSISHNAIALTLDLYALTARDLSACPHTRPHLMTARHPVAFVESESSPDEFTVDWRGALKSEINARATSEHERIAAIFSRSCKALEARCDNVEQPLRVALSEKQQLQEKCDKLHEAVANLESEKIDLTLQFDALETERDEAFQDVEYLRAENDQLDSKCRDLDYRISETLKKAETDIAEVKRSMEAAELEHATTLARKEEDLETLRTQLEDSDEEFKREKRASEVTAAELDQAKTELASNQEKLEQLNAVEWERENDIRRLMEEKKDLLKANEILAEQVAAVNNEVASVQEAHQDNILRLEAEASQKLAAAEENHKNELTDLINAHDEAFQGLKRKLVDLEDESNQAQARHLTETGRHDSEIREKQQKIDRLTRKCEQKDKQIAEANTMRTNLMAAMGLGGGQSLAALPHRPSQSATVHNYYEDEQTQEDPSPPTPCSGDDATTLQLAAERSFASNASSNDSRSGPTPKRPRPKRSSRSTTTPPAQPRLRASTASRASRSPVKRQPLLAISANSAKKPKAEMSKAALHERPVGPDDTTYDGSDLFAGTPDGRT